MDWLVMAGWPILVTVISDLGKLNFLTSTVLFFGVPAVYLSFRRPDLIKKTLIFTFVASVFLIPIFDYLAYVDRSWFVPNSAWRFMRGTIPVEDVVWTVLWVYFAIIFWEYFLDLGPEKHKLDKRFRSLIALLGGLGGIFAIFYWLRPEYLVVPYFYLKMGIVFIIVPLFLLLTKFPKLIKRFVMVGIYFTAVSFLAEYIGLKNNQWLFAGKNYLLTTKLAGQSLPWEEIVFWWVLGVPGLVCWYEYFADDRK